MSASAVFWGVIALVAVALAMPFVTSVIKYLRWRSLPRVNDYLTTNPHCRTPRGLKCVACNSSSIKNWGLTGANDDDRVFICNHCGTNLYRN